MAKYGSLPDIRIGDLRFLVTLATRQQISDPDGTGIVETFINPLQVYAAITPIGTQTWIGSEQTDTPITHKIWIRWSPSLDMFDVVLRQIALPDGSGDRQEIFRIRRQSEWEGRYRFLLLECDLERRSP